MRMARFSKFEEKELRNRLKELYRRKEHKEYGDDPTIYNYEISAIESALKEPTENT